MQNHPIPEFVLHGMVSDELAKKSIQYRSIVLIIIDKISNNMGTASSRVGEYMKLTQEQRALVKRVWAGIENNPQFHGSVFFMGFCEIHPRYIKYFTTESKLPLTFDAHTNAKFTIIMETMGYLLLDFHNKSKQLDRVIGYVAMIHKDMSLARSDMFNFGVSLLEYLSVTFPMAMTPDCLDVISKYMNNLLGELSEKIEDFKNNENLESFGTLKIPCGSWLLCGENLIYGQTLQYWKERKNRWDELIEEWKVKQSTIVNLTKTSSTDDEETSLVKSKTEEETSEFAESTERLLESHGIPRTTKIDTSPSTSQSRVNGQRKKSHDKLSRSRRPRQQAKKYETIIDEDAIVHEFAALTSYKTPREKRRSLLDEIPEARRISRTPDGGLKNSVRSSTERLESVNLQFSLIQEKIDSVARQRRRRSQSQSEPS